MSNVNAPAGLIPHSYLNGAQWNGQARMYYIPSSDTNAYAIGDPMTLGGSADASGVPSAILATAGTSNALLGPIVGMGGKVYGGAVGVDPISQDRIIIPATKTVAYYVLIADDPNIVFEIQEDSVSANLAAADVGTNVNLVSGTNNGYISGWMLDSTPTAATATLQCQLLGAVQRIDNAIGQYCKWLVRMNNHNFKAGTTGA